MPAAKFEIKRKCQVCGQEFMANDYRIWMSHGRYENDYG